MKPIHANDNSLKYKNLNGKTIKEFEQEYGKIKSIQYAESFFNYYGIIFEFEINSLPSLQFWFADNFDLYRFENDKSYSECCEFIYWEDEENKGNIRFGVFNKSKMKKPRLFADDFIAEFKHLHSKTLSEYLDLEDLESYDLYGEDVKYGIEIQYKNSLKPNIVFKFSKNFNLKMLKEDESYVYHCQFFYWEDEKGQHIRLANPRYYITESESFAS